MFTYHYINVIENSKFKMNVEVIRKHNEDMYMEIKSGWSFHSFRRYL